MDYTKRLFTYFREDATRTHLIIAPKAPPIERSGNGIDIAMESILDENDITDTLVRLRTQGEASLLTRRPANAPDKLSDVFCLSIKNVGRFRIRYLTQRGSKTLSMQRIPFQIQGCSELKLDEPTVERMLQVLRDPLGGITVVFGPSPAANSSAVYALLSHINSDDRRVILVLERKLTHLMRHDSSIVIQQELGSDYTLMDHAICEGLDLSPDIIFVGDLMGTDRIPSLIRAVETQASVILSVVATETESYLHLFKTVFGDQYSIVERRMQEVLKITPLPGGALTAELVTKTAATSRS